VSDSRLFDPSISDQGRDQRALGKKGTQQSGSLLVVQAEGYTRARQEECIWEERFVGAGEQTERLTSSRSLFSSDFIFLQPITVF